MKTGMIFILVVALVLSRCSKDTKRPLRYFEVGIKGTQDDWRDSSFVVATSDVQLINKINDQLEKPVTSRQIVMGELATGNGGIIKTPVTVLPGISLKINGTLLI